MLNPKFANLSLELLQSGPRLPTFAWSCFINSIQTVHHLLWGIYAVYTIVISNRVWCRFRAILERGCRLYHWFPLARIKRLDYQDYLLNKIDVDSEYVLWHLHRTWCGLCCYSSTVAAELPLWKAQQEPGQARHQGAASLWGQAPWGNC